MYQSEWNEREHELDQSLPEVGFPSQFYMKKKQVFMMDSEEEKKTRVWSSIYIPLFCYRHFLSRNNN
jgi:hypothetical protein